MSETGDNDKTKKDTTICTRESLQHRRIPDAVIAKSWAEGLNDLSSEERTTMFDVMHGVIDQRSQEETEQRTSTCSNDMEDDDKLLQALEEEIRKIEGQKRTAYDLARTMDAQYVENKDFCLMFLHAEKYISPKASAKRIMIHFELKLELFGENKLVTNISYDDLSASDQESVCCGSYQFLDVQDSTGRSIGFVFPELEIAVARENFLRARWYQFMAALESKSTVKHGIVGVIIGNLPVNFCNKYIKNGAFTKFQHALPCHFVGLHFCSQKKEVPASLKALRSVFQMILNRFRVRIQFHFEDSYRETIYKLQSFGIDPSTVPLESDGTPKTDEFLKVLSRRQEYETKRANQSISTTTTRRYSSPDMNTRKLDTQQESRILATTKIIPTPNDVLLGRGPGCQAHAGNHILGEMILEEVSAYEAATTQFDKTCIVWRTVKRHLATGGRFLRQSHNHNDTNKEEEWVIADDDTVRTSVSNRFRIKIRTKQTKGSSFSSKTTSITSTTSTTSTSVDTVAKQRHRQQSLKQQPHQQLQPYLQNDSSSRQQLLSEFQQRQLERSQQQQQQQQQQKERQDFQSSPNRKREE